MIANTLFNNKHSIGTNFMNRLQQDAALSSLPISPIRAQLQQFRKERHQHTELILSDDGEHLRHAIENNSWLLIRRLLDVPGKHTETDNIYPKGLINPVSLQALQEVNTQGWTALHALCFHGAPAGLIVYTITRLLSEKETQQSGSDSDLDSEAETDAEQEEAPIDWNAVSDPENVDNPEETAAKQQQQTQLRQEEDEEAHKKAMHPVSRVDHLQNNVLHLLFGRSTKEGDGTKRVVKSEARNLLRIARTILTFDPSLVLQKNLNGHSPLHILLASTGAGGKIGLPLLRVMKKCHSTFVQEPDPSGSLPLHTLCSLSSPYELVETVLDWYPHAVRVLDRKGRTPLHCLLMLKEPRIPIIKLLLKDYRFALNVVDSMGRTPLLTAVVTAGAEHPPPMALMRLLKPDTEWVHPEAQEHRTFDWYGSGTKKHPHVYGLDFDNIDVTTPAVQLSTKIALRPPSEKSFHSNRKLQRSPRARARKRSEALLKKQQPWKFGCAEEENVTNPRAQIQDMVRQRLPPKFNKLALELIMPAKKKGSVLVQEAEAQFDANAIQSMKGNFRWYAEGNVIGPDFLGNMPKNEDDSRLLKAVNRIELENSLQHEPSSDATLRSSGVGVMETTNSQRRPFRRSPERPHLPFQLSSTISGERRKELINQLTLSPRYRERMTEKAVASKDYERSTLRHSQLNGSLRSKYFKQPSLLRSETPVQRRRRQQQHRGSGGRGSRGFAMDLPEHPVDARADQRTVRLL